MRFRAASAASSATWARPARASCSASPRCSSIGVPLGEGGVIEPAERDELDQLQRLIDYGVDHGHELARRRRPARGLGGRAQAAQRARARSPGLHARQLRALPQPDAAYPSVESPRSCAMCSTSSRARKAASSSFRSRSSARASFAATFQNVPHALHHAVVCTTASRAPTCRLTTAWTATWVAAART